MHLRNCLEIKIDSWGFSNCKNVLSDIMSILQVGTCIPNLLLSMCDLDLSLIHSRVWSNRGLQATITIFVNLGLFRHFETVTNIRTWIKSHMYWENVVRCKHFEAGVHTKNPITNSYQDGLGRTTPTLDNVVVVHILIWDKRKSQIYEYSDHKLARGYWLLLNT